MSIEIEEIAKKYNLEPETVANIIKKYNTFDNFIQMYRNNKVNEEERKLFNELIDLDSNPYNENYYRLIRAVFGEVSWWYYPGVVKDIYFFSSKNIDEVLHTLSPREEEIIRIIFGLDNGIVATFRDCAEHYDIHNQNTVRQVQTKALKKLREPVNASKIKPKALKKLKESEYIVEEEIKMLSELENDIWNSGLIFKHNDAGEVDFDYTKLPIVAEIIENTKKRREVEFNQIEEARRTLNEMHLSTRAYRALTFEGIDTLDKLKNLTYEELKNIRGLGQKSFEEIITKLSERGISLLHEDEIITNRANSSSKVTLIREVNFSGRAFNALDRKGIINLEQLANFTYEEVKNFKGLGNQSFEEVIDMLHEYGILLKDSGDKEIKKLISKKNELEIRLKELDEETRQCKELLDTYNKLIYGDKTNTEDEAPDFKDE